MNGLAALPTVVITGERSTTVADLTFGDVLRAVCARLEGMGAHAEGQAREAAALAIIEEVARFVLQWQEGPPRSLAGSATLAPPVD